MKRLAVWTLKVTLALFLLPAGLHAAVYAAKGWPASWRDADWSSARLLAPATDHDAATIHVYAARVGRWRGMFASHSWIVLKPRGAAQYRRYDVVGWGDPVRLNAYAADARWYGNVPELVGAIEGEKAEALIPRIEAAIAAYPFSARGDYRMWPGPNSNSFIASILAAVPEAGISLPPTALGRDYPTRGDWLALENGTFTATLGGYAGVAVGLERGLEVNLLGLVAGIDPDDAALSLPGFGRFALLP